MNKALRYKPWTGICFSGSSKWWRDKTEQGMRGIYKGRRRKRRRNFERDV